MKDNREAIILADQLGYTEAWIGEHQTSIAEPISDPYLFLATVIHATKNIRFGTAVLNLPYHHPVKLGMQIAMFDQLSGGRTLVGIGPGGLVSDLEIFDIDNEKSYDMMIECMDVMQILWTQDAPIHYQGNFWSVSLEKFLEDGIGVGRLPKPLQKPYPPIAYAMRSPKSGASKLLAERNWIPISGNFVPSGFVKSQWDDYCNQRENFSRRPDPENWRAGRSILITKSNSEADEYLSKKEGGFRHYFHYLRTVEVKRNMMDATFEEREAVVTSKVNEALEDQVIAGDANTVLEKLVAFREEVGPFGTLLMTGHDWDDRELWIDSMKALSNVVMPRLSQHASATDPTF
tara:strand:- start:853 stop:1893 length:1041 start_codon:yes stop_codon:yes gene_type:complete